jgi:hypothetical protein
MYICIYNMQHSPKLCEKKKKLQASLDYMVGLCLKKKKERKKEIYY